MSICLAFLSLIASISGSLLQNKCYYAIPSLMKVELPSIVCSGISTQDEFKIPHPMINKIVISDSNVSVVKTQFLKNFPKLMVYHAENSQIREVERDAFHNSQSLHRVEIIHNNLTRINPDLFWNCPKIAAFNLTGNPGLIIPDEEPFLNAPQLKWLDIRRCNIQMLTFANFKNVPNLTFLSLAGNQLRALYEDVFKALPNLKMLDLTGNKLRTVSLMVFSYMHNPAALYLSGNPWDCNCSMYPVIKCLTQFAKDNVKCAEPDGRNWITIADQNCSQF